MRSFLLYIFFFYCLFTEEYLFGLLVFAFINTIKNK